jgi:hypothetical protein
VSEEQIKRISRRSVHLYAWVGILQSTFAIGMTTAWGNPQNSMHVSAQSWGFIILVFSLAMATGTLAYLDRLMRRP